MPPGTADRITSSELAIVFLLLVRICNFPFAKSRLAATRLRIVDHKHHDRAHNCDDHAPNVQAANARGAKKIEQKAPSIAPIIPSAMLSQKPWPSPLTILLPINQRSGQV
jgi:hypothetical protein